MSGCFFALTFVAAFPPHAMGGRSRGYGRDLAGSGSSCRVPVPAPSGLGRWARGCRAGKKKAEAARRCADPPLGEGPSPAEHVAFAASVVGQAGAALGFSAIEVSCMIGGISGWLSTSPGGWCAGPTWTSMDLGSTGTDHQLLECMSSGQRREQGGICGSTAEQCSLSWTRTPGRF